MQKGKNNRSTTRFAFFKKMAKAFNSHPNVTFCLFLIVILILVPLCLLFILHPVSDSNSSTAIWIGFWGSFLGGIIGAVVTYFVMIRTFNENNRNNDTERNSSLKLHRAETLRNDYRDQSKCINLFVDQIQEIISNFQVMMLPEKNHQERICQEINEKTIAIKADLKKTHDAIFDIPISDEPAKPYLQKIDKIYYSILYAIDKYSDAVKNTCDYIAKMKEEDSSVVAKGDIRYIETAKVLTTPFDKTILTDVFNIKQNRETGNLVAHDNSSFAEGWIYLSEDAQDVCFKPITCENGLFLVSSPDLTQAFFLEEGKNMLYETYRIILMKLLHKIESFGVVDANVKNFQNCIEKYLDNISFDELMVIPIVITRDKELPSSSCSSISENDEVCPIIMTDSLKEMIQKRLKDEYDFIWKITDSDRNSIPKCRFEIDDELREELFGHRKDDYLLEDEECDELVPFDNARYVQYLDFVFGDFSHPEISLIVKNPQIARKILSVPSFLEGIHNQFYGAIKRELIELSMYKTEKYG